MSISQEYKKWREITLKRAVAKVPQRKEDFITSSGIEIPDISTSG